MGKELETTKRGIQEEAFHARGLSPAALRASGARLARPSRESPLGRRGRTARSRDPLSLIVVAKCKVVRLGA